MRSWIIKCSNCGLNRVEGEKTLTHCTQARKASDRRTMVCGRLLSSVDEIPMPSEVQDSDEVCPKCSGQCVNEIYSKTSPRERSFDECQECGHQFNYSK